MVGCTYLGPPISSIMKVTLQRDPIRCALPTFRKGELVEHKDYPDNVVMVISDGSRTPQDTWPADKHFLGVWMTGNIGDATPAFPKSEYKVFRGTLHATN